MSDEDKSDNKSSKGESFFDALPFETLEGLNSVFLASNQKISTDVQFVVHTSTIPLSSVLSVPLRGTGIDQSLVKNGMCCHKNADCMFTTSSLYQNLQIVSDKCPCRNYEDAANICFLQILPSLGRKINPFPEEVRYFELEKILWCTDATSIFDAVYNNEMQKVSHSKGWEFVLSPEAVLICLRQLYWFQFVPSEIQNLIRESQINSLKTYVYNILQTIDGLIIKMFYSFPLETHNYRDLALKTANLFSKLLTDYVKQSESGISKTYSQIKPFLQEVGLLFHSRDQQVRMSIIDGGLRKYPAMANFFSACFTAYYEHVLRVWSTREVDLTLTLSWVYRMAFFCKTRVIGHVPECDAYPSDLEYLKSVSQPEEKVDKELLKLLSYSVHVGLRAEQVEQGGLREFGAEKLTNEILETLEDLDFEVKPTADATHTRTEGGKCESGRALLQMLREENLKIPIFDLQTGDLAGEFDPPEPGASGYKRAVFWACLNILLNDLSERFPELKFDPKFEWPKKYREDLFSTEVVRINEPGKIRRLVKTSNTLNAALAIGSSLLASQLAQGKSHNVGMKGSNQSWNFEQRLGRDSDESAFMYSDDLSELKPEVVFGFQDWSKASDYVNKRIGLMLLSAAYRWVSFPVWYGGVILRALGEPLSFRYRVYNTTHRERITKSGWITRGFMMGLQNTKNILHLLHYCAGSLTDTYLQQLGWVKVVSYPYRDQIIRVRHNEVLPQKASIL